MLKVGWEFGNILPAEDFVWAKLVILKYRVSEQLSLFKIRVVWSVIKLNLIRHLREEPALTKNKLLMSKV